MSSKVSIVVLNWNGWQQTVCCLATLFESTYDNYEVILIDNGSNSIDLEKIHEWLDNRITAKTKSVLTSIEAKPKVVYEYSRLELSQTRVDPREKSLTIIKSEKNLGFAAGCNLGITYALKDKEVSYIGLFNNDMEIAQDCISKLITEIDCNKRVGACQPKILLSTEQGLIDSVGVHLRWFGSAVQIGYRARDQGQYDKTFKVFGACGGAVLYRREMLENIGLFDKDFFAYLEDVDLSCRAARAGWTALSVPFAVSYHVHSASLGKNSAMKWSYILRNSVYVVVKNMPVFSIVVFLLFFYPLFIAVCLYKTRSERGAFFLILRAVRDGLGSIPHCIKKRYQL
jgi:GT2 family glycosyltransferase